MNTLMDTRISLRTLEKIRAKYFFKNIRKCSSCFLALTLIYKGVRTCCPLDGNHLLRFFFILIHYFSSLQYFLAVTLVSNEFYHFWLILDRFKSVDFLENTPECLWFDPRLIQIILDLSKLFGSNQEVWINFGSILLSCKAPKLHLEFSNDFGIVPPWFGKVHRSSNTFLGSLIHIPYLLYLFDLEMICECFGVPCMLLDYFPWGLLEVLK